MDGGVVRDDADIREQNAEKRADDGRAYFLHDRETAFEKTRERHHEEHEGEKRGGLGDHRQPMDWRSALPQKSVQSPTVVLG